MRLLSKLSLSALLVGLSISCAHADSFVVSNIRIQGLQGISRNTVLSYLPVRAGERFDTAQSGQVIQSLYATGLFSNISVGRQGNTLLVNVVERPIIANVIVDGNKTIPKDKLDGILKQIGLRQGDTFNQAVLENLKHSLENEYVSIGKYNVRVTSTVTPQPRNRVLVKINISEGLSVKVKQIDIIGNKAFSSSTLIRQMTLTTPRPWSFFTHGDLYTEDKLDASLKAISNYYMDRGYLKFKIDSVQSSLSPDRNYVYITVHVTEGPIYTIQGTRVVGNLVLPQTKLDQTLATSLKPGSVFSREKVTNMTKAIKNALGDMGYLNATVNAIPTIDENSKQVFLTFYIEQGGRVYIRRVNIKGNPTTEDVVLRRAMPQMEGSLSSTSAIEESKRQLNILGYLQDVTETNVPVPGVPDEVDADYHVKEAPSAQAMASAGYGTDGLVLSAGINESNFMGTGKAVGLNFSRSSYVSTYSFSYNNPYYTKDGVSRGFNIYAQRYTPGSVNITSYTTNMYGGTINYGIPVSQYDSLQLGFGYQRTHLFIGSTPSIQLNQFVLKNGSRFNQTLLNAGWTHNSLDRAIFPTKGLFQSLGVAVSAPAGGTPLDYYKASYDMEFFHPLFSDFIFNARAGLGYGNGYGPTKGLPFFVNYYAGGLGYDGQVRGYSTNTLGPVDSQGNYLGGNKLLSGTAAIIFPNFISKDRLRTSLFMDAGNVYTTQPPTLGGTGPGPIRYSAGLDIQWRVPVMNTLLEVSLAHAINPQGATPGRPPDQTSFFQFNLGSSF